MTETVASATAPINLAVIKYWGKRDTTLNLPTNSSLSVTLSQADLCAHTTARASPKYTADRLWLNGTEEDVVSNRRLQACLAHLRRLRVDLETVLGDDKPLSKQYLHIVSSNNFPTAAGLASSAAGFAALVRAVADLFQLDHTSEELSVIARQGSGSACRSLFGGYVKWDMGEAQDGRDSRAVLVAPQAHWPDMRAAIFVVSGLKKTVSSTNGMQTTVRTSTLFRERIEHVVPKRIKQMEAAILERDFQAFAKLTMADSNQFHAVCLDSDPPIMYLNDTSRLIILSVNKLNTSSNKLVAAYTFDAGPNAVIFYLEQDKILVLDSLSKGVGSGIPGLDADPASTTKSTIIDRVIHTKVGDAPKAVSTHLSL